MAHRQRAETYAKQLQAANGRILELEGEVADRDDKLAKLNETKVKHETALREHLAKAVRDQETAKTTLGKKIEEMKETETMLRTQLATRAITEATTNTMTRAISTDKLKNAANAEQTLRKQNSHLSDQNQKLQTELASKNGEIATLEKRVNDLIDAEKVEKESKKRKASDDLNTSAAKKLCSKCTPVVIDLDGDNDETWKKNEESSVLPLRQKSTTRTSNTGTLPVDSGEEGPVSAASILRRREAGQMQEKRGRRVICDESDDSSESSLPSPKLTNAYELQKAADKANQALHQARQRKHLNTQYLRSR